MKIISALSAMLVGVSLASAAPVDGHDPTSGALKARMLTARNSLVDGDSSNCPKVILIYARGTREIGNMIRHPSSTQEGATVGPALAGSLEDAYEGMWVQGVGGNYTAALYSNFLPAGATQNAIDEAKNLFTVAHDKCPDSVVLAGGYSQGAAVIGGAITHLKDKLDVQDQVAGVVLFGNTMSQENGGRIPDFPEEKTREYCETGDVLCHGILIPLPTHALYMDEAAIAAPIFLRGRVDAATQGGW